MLWAVYSRNAYVSIPHRGKVGKTLCYDYYCGRYVSIPHRGKVDLVKMDIKGIRSNTFQFPIGVR